MLRNQQKSCRCVVVGVLELIYRCVSYTFLVLIQAERTECVIVPEMIYAQK
jgi:hypothetical protein